MLKPSFSAQFKRDRKKAGKQGKDIAKLDAVVTTLTAEQPLAPAQRDHELSGEWQDCRECHINPDWLLIYRITDEELELLRTGSHSDLFG
jgi:mRNA interferase YafQ